MASISAYLLKLAQEPQAAARHAQSASAAKAQMTEFGLDEKQQTILASNDTAQISEAVQAEYTIDHPNATPMMISMAIVTNLGR